MLPTRVTKGHSEQLELSWIILRAKFGQRIDDAGQICRRLRHRYAVLQPSQDEPTLRHSRKANRHSRMWCLRNPHIGVIPAKASWHDSHQSSCRPIQHKNLVQHIRIPVEARLPDLVAKYEYGRCPRLVVCGLKDAAEQGRQAKKLKGARCYIGSIEPFDTRTMLVKHGIVSGANHAVKRVVLTRKRQKLI